MPIIDCSCCSWWRSRKRRSCRRPRHRRRGIGLRSCRRPRTVFRFACCRIPDIARLSGRTRRGLAVRTGLGIFSVLFVAATISEYRRNPSTRRTFIGIFSITAIIISSLIFGDFFSNDTDVRAINFRGGLEGSLLPKWVFFRSYIETRPEVWQSLFGCFDISLVEYYTGSWGILDSEWGNAYFAYGLTFCIAIVIFYVAVYRRTPKATRLHFIILLWVISSTLLFSYRASFIFLLLLSKYYISIKKNK